MVTTASLPVSDLQPGDMLWLLTDNDNVYFYEVSKVVVENGTPWVLIAGSTNEVTFCRLGSNNVIQRGSAIFSYNGVTRAGYTINGQVDHLAINGKTVF